MGKWLYEIFEIMDDIDSETDDNAFKSMFNIGKTYGSFNRSTNGIDVIKTFFPNILGFLLGVALTRLLGLGGIVYLIAGIAFSLGFAVFYSVKFKGKSFKYALKRHAFVIGGITLIFGIVCIVYILLEK